METEKITQPPEATGARDLSAAHALTDAQHDAMFRIISDDEALAKAVLICAENGAVPGWADAVGAACRRDVAPMLEFFGKAARWMAARGQCDRCLGITDGDHCAVCDLIDRDCGEDLDHDAETMDEPAGGRLES